MTDKSQAETSFYTHKYYMYDPIFKGGVPENNSTILRTYMENTSLLKVNNQIVLLRTRMLFSSSFMIFFSVCVNHGAFLLIFILGTIFPFT